MKLWTRALPPCDHCFEKAYGKRSDETAKDPSLDDFHVQPIRLGTRHGYGITVWTAQPDSDDAVPLKRALLQGSHLCILRDPFAARGATAGAVPQTHVLLQAVQEKVIDDSTPYSGLVAAETNMDAWTEFKKQNLDPGAYIRRSRIAHHGYNRVVSRETLAYRDLLAREAQAPTFDPFALDIIAHLAVYTRLRETLAGEFSGLDMLTRINIYDGDLDALEMFIKSKTGASVVSDPKTAVAAVEREAVIKDWMNRLWETAGPDEGFAGLNMSFMLFDIINSLRQFGLTCEGQRLTVWGATAFLLERIRSQMNSTDVQNNADQKKLYENCLKQLTWVKSKEDKPNLLERVFRQWLKQAIEDCFCPEAETLKNQLFWQYFQHAKARSRAARTFEDVHTGETIDVSTAVLDQIEKLIPDLNKGTVSEGADNKQIFRGSLAPRVKKALELARRSLGDPKADLEATWETLPELKLAIAKMHTDEILKKIKLCFDSEGKQLDPEDEALRIDSRARFKALGYSDKSGEEVLKYYVNYELWRTDDRR